MLLLCASKLDNANLGGAALQSASLVGTSLCEAQLNASVLLETQLCGANLQGADLRGAVLIGTVFAETNLRHALLDSCTFHGTCSIDSGTHRRSGSLSLSFLRGCGLQDWEIEAAKLYDQTLTNDQFIDIQQRIYDLRQGPPIQYQSLFISYASVDKEVAIKIHKDLQDNGVRCWFAPEDLMIGQKIRPGINEAIQNHERALVILSKQSVTSTWVQAEVETALEKESNENREVLFPIRVDEEVMQSKDSLLAHIRRTTHIGNFTTWQNENSYQQAFRRLLKDLREGRPKG